MGKASRGKKERKAVAALSTEERYEKGLCTHCGQRPRTAGQTALWCAECGLAGRRKAQALRSRKASRATLEQSLRILDK